MRVFYYFIFNTTNILSIINEYYFIKLIVILFVLSLTLAIPRIILHTRPVTRSFIIISSIISLIIKNLGLVMVSDSKSMFKKNPHYILEALVTRYEQE